MLFKVNRYEFVQTIFGCKSSSEHIPSVTESAAAQTGLNVLWGGVV